MTYLTESAILEAIEDLKTSTHPFLGITFLACKKRELPVGRTTQLKLDALTRNHLERHHRLDGNSSHFFQPFKSPRNWVKGSYASDGLQAVNTHTFRRVFLHERGSMHWGFAEDYVDLIKRMVHTLGYRTTRLDAIAIWMAKREKWRPDTTVKDLVEDFLRRYNITPREQRALFAPAPPVAALRTLGWDEPDSLVQRAVPDLRAIAHRIEPPPDARAPKGTLAAIELSKVGPSDRLRLDLGDRLTVIGGDNGLGKSFLLDVIWWAATERWAGMPAIPFGPDAKRSARISYDLRTDTGVRTCYGSFEPRSRTWVHRQDHPQVEALHIYAGVDGTFFVEDQRKDASDASPINLTAREVWDGKEGHTEGLVRDVVNWQFAKEEWIELFQRLLSHLSPSDLGTLRLGAPNRIPGRRRWFPVIQHPYGDVPVLYASAGVRRVLAMAYVMVWAWQEHRVASELRGERPARRLVLLVDEIDAHLHPFWQRMILPAILEVGELLDERLKTQVVVSTHSPFVLASLETRFDAALDALYHLRLDGADVHLEREDFYKRGSVSSWLTAPIFGLRHARSKEAEEVLDEAIQLQVAGSDDRSEIERGAKRLVEVLPSDDPFWRRWMYFAEQAGVDL